MVNIVLLEPRTSGNVGTIGRTVVALGGKLHLIRPYGWGNDITQKEVKKAGLDYWDRLEWYQYDSIEDFWAKNPLNDNGDSDSLYNSIIASLVSFDGSNVNSLCFIICFPLICLFPLFDVLLVPGSKME